MMRNKHMIRTLAVLLAVMLCMTAFSTVAFASDGEAATTSEAQTEPTDSADITGDDLRRQPRIYCLEIHLAFSNLTAFNPHIRHFGKNRKHSFCNFGIIDSPIPFGKKRPRVAVQRAHHSLLRGHREPAVHILRQQFGILRSHLIIILSRDAKR